MEQVSGRSQRLMVGLGSGNQRPCIKQMVKKVDLPALVEQIRKVQHKQHTQLQVPLNARLCQSVVSSRKPYFRRLEIIHKTLVKPPLVACERLSRGMSTKAP